MNRSKLTVLSCSLGVVTMLVTLAGCKFPGAEKKESTPAPTTVGGGKICATIGPDKRPFITTDELEKKLKQMLQAYRAQVDPASLPPQTKRRFLDDLVKMRVVKDVWSKDAGILNTSEFKQALEERMDAAREAVVVEFFMNDLRKNIDISDRAVDEDFKKNKDRYVKVAGGVLVSGVSFENEAAAKAFMAKAKTEIAEFENLAKKEKGGAYSDFGRLSERMNPMVMSRVPEPVLKAAMQAKKVPSIEMVKDDKLTWVISVTDKKDAVYFELDEIRGQIKEMLKENKFREELDKAMNELVKKADIHIDESLFKVDVPSMGKGGLGGGTANAEEAGDESKSGGEDVTEAA